MRQLFRFDLKLALLLMVNCSILAWMGVDTFHTRPQRGWPHDEVFHTTQESSPYAGTMASVSIVSSAFTFVWLTRNTNRPILMGAIGGILGLVALLSVCSLVLGVHCIFYFEGGEEYAEDGAFLGLVVVPIFVSVFCSPVLAAVGALVGGVFLASQVAMRRWTAHTYQQSQQD